MTLRCGICLFPTLHSMPSCWGRGGTIYTTEISTHYEQGLLRYPDSCVLHIFQHSTAWNPEDRGDPHSWSGLFPTPHDPKGHWFCQSCHRSRHIPISLQKAELGFSDVAPTLWSGIFLMCSGSFCCLHPACLGWPVLEQHPHKCRVTLREKPSPFISPLNPSTGTFGILPLCLFPLASVFVKLLPWSVVNPTFFLSPISRASFILRYVLCYYHFP